MTDGERQGLRSALTAAVEAYEREAGRGSCDRAAMALALEAALSDERILRLVAAVRDRKGGAE